MRFYLRRVKTYLIRGESLGLAKDLITFRSWLVEGIHHEMKIARQRGHDGDLVLACS